MTTGITQEDILQWVRERFEETNEGGALSLVRAMRFSANGQDVLVHQMTSTLSTSKWTAEEVAKTLGYVCDRDARGLPGVNQYELQACYGASAKPAGFLPFQRVGQLQYGPLPGGGLATEVASPVGITQVGMRWGEVAIQGAQRKDELIIGLLGRLLESERADKANVMKENREAMGLLRQFIADAMDKRVDMLRFDRNTKLIFEGIKVAPALLNQVTGQTILPGEEESVAEILYDSMTTAERVAYLQKLHLTSPIKASVMAGKMANIKKKRVAEAKELREMGASVKEPTMAEAEAEMGADDVIDHAIDVLRGPDVPTNGATNGKPAASKEPEGEPSIDKRQAHAMSAPKARWFVESMAESLGEKLPLKHAWEGDHLIVDVTGGPGKGIAAWIGVTDAELRVRVWLPMLAKLLKSTIEGELDGALAKVQEHAEGTKA